MSEQNKADKIKEMLEMEKNHKKTPSDRICERFYEDVKTYLNSKLFGFPEHEIMEMAVFCANRMAVTANDLILERDREWRDMFSREENRNMRMRRAAEMNFGDKED